MRNKICLALREGDMIEKEMPMPIGKYVKQTRKTALEIAEKRGLKEGYEYYWTYIMGRIELYRRDCEIKYALNLADKYEPISYDYIDEKKFIDGVYTCNQKVYYYKDGGL
jgi:hypothetical protein